MGFLQDLFHYTVKESFGCGRSKFGSSSFRYTRGHRRKTDTYSFAGPLGLRARYVSGRCNRCDGNGRLHLTCRNCSGSGRFTGTCRNCNGSGTFTFRSGRSAPCRRCYGSGKFSATCRKCSGRGTWNRTCRKCGGSGCYSRTFYR